jgi:AcrR family transcriptional regulator
MKSTKHDITLQALKFFAENDYDRASLNNIAKAMDVTKGAIYHYFKNKDELFEECIRFVTNSMDSFFIQMMPENPTVEFLINTFLKNTDISKMIKVIWGIDMKFDSITFTNLIYTGMKKFPAMKMGFRESYTQMLSMIEGLIIKEQAEGVIKANISPRLTALELVTMTEGGMLMSEFYSDEDNSIFKNYADELWNRLKV